MSAPPPPLPNRAATIICVKYFTSNAAYPTICVKHPDDQRVIPHDLREILHDQRCVPYDMRVIYQGFRDLITPRSARKIHGSRKQFTSFSLLHGNPGQACRDRVQAHKQLAGVLGTQSGTDGSPWQPLIIDVVILCYCRLRQGNHIMTAGKITAATATA